MAVTTLKSAQVTAIQAGGLANWQDPYDLTCSVVFCPWDYTQVGAGDQNSTCDLCYLPAGKHRVFGAQSSVEYPSMTNGAIQIGHAGYTQPDGTVVNASATAISAAITTTSAGRAVCTVPFFDYESKDPLLVRLKASGSGGIADTANLKGVFCVSR